MITEDAARAAFRKWQRVFRLCDLDIEVEFAETESAEGGEEFETGPTSDAHRNSFTVTVHKSAFNLSPREFWMLSFHEIFHVINWPYVDVIDIFRDCDPVLVATAEKIEEKVSEAITYKLQEIIPRLVRMPVALVRCGGGDA